MKNKTVIIFILILCLMLPACSADSGSEDIVTGADTAVSGIEKQTEQTSAEEEAIEENAEMSGNNKAIIAEALGVSEDSRNLRFIINTLDTIGAGQIKNAEAGTDGTGIYIDISAEDDIMYRMYLSGSGSVDAVKNMDTGEWPVRSRK